MSDNSRAFVLYFLLTISGWLAIMLDICSITTIIDAQTTPIRNSAGLPKHMDYLFNKVTSISGR